MRLAKALEDDPDIPELEISALLRNNKLNPILRLAETLCELMSDKQQRVKYLEALDIAVLYRLFNFLFQ